MEEDVSYSDWESRDSWADIPRNQILIQNKEILELTENVSHQKLNFKGILPE